MRKFKDEGSDIHKYIFDAGMEAIFTTCGENLRAVKEHFKRECPNAKPSALYYTIRKFKDYLARRVKKRQGKFVGMVNNIIEVNFQRRDK